MEAVGLEEVLARREERALAQARLHADRGLPLLSVTLVTPGPFKDSPRLRALMDRAEAALLSRLAALGAAVVERQRYEGRTGSELLLAVGGVDALRLKEAALELEEAQPWARLVDADVLVPGSEGRLGPITREMRGRPPRSCLVCGMPAGPCVREARHGAAELAAAVEALLPA